MKYSNTLRLTITLTNKLESKVNNSLTVKVVPTAKKYIFFLVTEPKTSLSRTNVFNKFFAHGQLFETARIACHQHSIGKSGG